MEHLRVPTLIAAVAMSTLGACTSLSGLTSNAGDDGADATSADGGSPSDVPGADATIADGGSASDVTGADAPPADAPPADAAGPSDTGSGEGGSGRFCDAISPAPLLCADFDVGALDAGWDGQNTSGGAMSLDPSSARSTPNSMVVTLNPIPASGSFSAVTLSRTFSSSIAAMTFSVDMSLEQRDPNQAYPKFASIALSNHYEIDFQINADGTAALTEITATTPVNYITSGVTGFVFPLQSWVHVEIQTEPPAGGWGIGSYTLSVTGKDGVVHSLHQTADASGALSAASPVQLSLGAFAIAGPSTAWKIRYDNALFLSR